ncbi:MULTISPECIES: TonB-dependent receptor [Bizionia]|uniref:TonB-dependent receptor n=1 Tax=Bizionia algoritergicola TaxID=291187 RepID=A0A5D0QYA3_9FLAO|nr:MULTISPECIES: TonB-dependent receptor [Bizionia]OBX24172.1 TonB-dependent receptor [Bizionia sp. APA-3]TYB73686.1 TonB-dependent receptor [Bizionia algoritergicola]
MKTILNLLFLSMASLAIGQNSINGIVTDAETDEGLPFVNIYFPQLEKGTTTDFDGNFNLENLPAGTYSLVYSFVGYGTKSMNLVIPTTETISLTLSSSAIEMEAVIISTPFHKLQSDNVMKVERQTIKELKASGAVTLGEGISNIAGVEGVSTGLGITKPVIRGLSSNRVLVYTQGVRLENQQFGDEHGLGLSDAGVESIEVIKGPASLLYGSDALGGVLYINPEKFAQENSNNADFGGTYFANTQGYSTSAGYKASGEAFKVLFRGSVTEHADYNTADYRVTNTRFKEQDFKAGVGYQSTNFKTDFRYNINHSKIGIPEEIGEQSTNKTPLLPYQELTNHIFSSRSTVFFNNSKLEFNLGYIYNDRKEFEDEHDHEDEIHDDEHEEHEEHDDHDEHDDYEEEHHDEHEALFPALQMKLKTANYDVKYHLPIMGKFETIVGIQGMNQINTNYGEEILIPDAVTNDFGILAMSHIHFEKFDLQLGARYDNRWLQINNSINKTFNSFNGAFGVKTNLTKNITARLNLATGFRAPNLAELTSDGVHHGTNRYEIGNIDLNTEQNFQTDLALEFKNKHIEFFVNGFYNHINDYIYLSPDGTIINNEPVYNYDQDNAALYGGEIGMHFHPHPIHWLHYESSFETVTGKLDSGSYLPLIPANSLSNTIRVELDLKPITNSYVFVKLRSVFNQGNVSTFETTTDGYNLLSAGFGGNVQLFNNDLSITISGTNLTDKTYINHLSRLKPDGIYNMGRNFSIGLTYSL